MGWKSGKPILVLDFDGVLHQYSEWRGAGIIPNRPVPGAVEFVREAIDYFSIHVFSSRSSFPEGIPAMRAWMQKHRFPIVNVYFPTYKPAAFLSIDDRGFHFSGAFPAPQELLKFKAWHEAGNGADKSSGSRPARTARKI